MTPVLQLQLEALMYLLIHSKYCFDQWSVITEIYKSVISNVDDDATRQRLNKAFINGATVWIKVILVLLCLLSTPLFFVITAGTII